MSLHNLFPGAAPALTGDSDNASVNLGVEFYTEQSGVTVTKIRYPHPASNGGSTQRQCGIFSTTDGVTGTLVAGPFTMPVPTAGAWCEYALGSPLALVPGVRYRAVVRHPDGKYGATGAQFGWGQPLGEDSVRGPVIMPGSINALGNDQGSYFYAGALAMSTGSFNDANYWTDIEVSVADAPSGSVEALGVLSGGAALPVSILGVWDGTSAVMPVEVP